MQKYLYLVVMTLKNFMDLLCSLVGRPEVKRLKHNCLKLPIHEVLTYILILLSTGFWKHSSILTNSSVEKETKFLIGTEQWESLPVEKKNNKY